MCKSQAEGGQRCAGHCRERVAAAKNRYIMSSSADTGETLHRWRMAEIEYASTPEGHAEAVRKAAAGEPAPVGNPSEYWAGVAESGDQLRERNSAIAALSTTEAIAAGNAFHAAAVAQAPDGDLPDSVRGPKSLERFLDDQVESTFVHAQTMRATTAELVAINSMAGWVLDTAPDPKAMFTFGVPRSHEEKSVWLDDLRERRDEVTARQRTAAKGYASAQSDLSAFGRAHPPTGTGEPQSSMEAGFVGRIRNPDGSLSKDVYLVTEQKRSRGADPAGPREKGMATVFPIRAGDPDLVSTLRTPVGAGMPVHQAEVMTVAHTSMVRAEPATWNQYVGTAPYDPTPSGQLFLRTPGEVLTRNYDNSRFYSADRRGVPFADPSNTNFVQNFIHRLGGRA